MNNLLSLVLIFSFILPVQQTFSQPLREQEEWSLNDEAIGWEPAEMSVDVGDTQIKVWILRPTVPAPVSGYLLKKPNFRDMKRILDNLEKEIKRVKDKERTHCDELLAEKDILCQKLNADLISQIDNQQIIISTRDGEIKSLNNEIFWTKVVSGAVVLGLSAFSIYASIR